MPAENKQLLMVFTDRIREGKEKKKRGKISQLHTRSRGEMLIWPSNETTAERVLQLRPHLVKFTAVPGHSPRSTGLHKPTQPSGWGCPPASPRSLLEFLCTCSLVGSHFVRKRQFQWLPVGLSPPWLPSLHRESVQGFCPLLSVFVLQLGA